MNMEDNIPTSKIDFIDLFIVFWKHKLFILKITLLFLSIGAIISFVLPKKYTVTIIMVPQINKSDNWGQLSSFAEMAGINLNLVNNSNILTPQVYPLIIKSIPLQVELLNSKVFIKNSKDSISIFDYYSIQARGVFEKLLPLRWSKTKSEEKQSTIQNMQGIYVMSKYYESIRKRLSNDLQLIIKEKEGLILLNVTMRNPEIAAQVALNAQKLLQKFITKYKIEKAQEQLKFCLQRLQEKKNEFEIIQRDLAMFRDKNKNITTASARIKEDDLQSKYNILYAVYTELAKQAEQLQLKVKEDTPILTIIEPVKIPTQKSSPDRILIIVVFSILGGIAGIFTVLIKEYLNDRSLK